MQIFKLHDKKRGFTLAEALIASVILVVTAIAFLDNLIQCSNLTETVSLKDIALNAARGKLEEIAHSDLTQVMNYNISPLNTFDVCVDQPPVCLTPPVGQAHAGSVAVAQVGTTNLFDVTITVNWQQRGRLMSRTIRTTLISKG
jgi:Tfp pilus assembly protein PilV